MGGDGKYRYRRTWEDIIKTDIKQEQSECELWIILTQNPATGFRENVNELLSSKMADFLNT
jgi:hypothetical protein